MNTPDTNEIILEIPVWVHGRRKWVTGITKKTTFDDLIYALLVQADLFKSSESIAGYAIAECLQSSPESLLTQRIFKGRSKVNKIHKTWQFDRFPLTVLHLISTSSTSKSRSKIFRRFLSSKDFNDDEEPNLQELFNHYQENLSTLERQKRLLECLDEKIQQTEKSSSTTTSSLIVSLNDVLELLSSKSIEQEQLILATQLCNSIFNIQEHIEEKHCISQAVERAISNELNHVTLPIHFADQTPSSNDLISLKNSISRSRELSRMQAKEMHDLDLSLRESEILLASKYDEMKTLEQETSTNIMARSRSLTPHFNSTKQLHIDEQPTTYETFDMAFTAMKEIDEDSGINSLTSEDSNHQSTPMIHQKQNIQLVTLV